MKTLRHEVTPSDTLAAQGLKKVAVCYGASKYLSHARVARAYREIIRDHCTVVKEIDAADIAVLHFEPPCFPSLFDKHPALKKKYAIGYCVWEAEGLPVAYQKGISHIQEVWTCSQYCCDVLGKYHPRVKYVPHVAERDTCCSDGDRQHIRTLVSHNPNNFYFLMITKLWDLRKNTKTLVEAFVRQRAAMPDARLIIKAGLEDIPRWLSQDSVIVLREHLSDAQMNALYESTDAYVSPHHSEGWGLTLSDAMIFQKPVVATGYSGNCEFMNADNSLPLNFTVSNIKREDCFGYFDPSMRWAYPSEDNLEQKLLLLYQKRGSSEIKKKVGNALQDVQKFDRPSVSSIVRKRIADTVDSTLFSKTVARK